MISWIFAWLEIKVIHKIQIFCTWFTIRPYYKEAQRWHWAFPEMLY